MHIRAFLVALTLCASTVSANAQSLAGLGAISGTVTDASGAVIPSAKVIVANTSTGIRRNLETNEAGRFSAPSLPPGGGYQVSAVKEGFASYEAKGITIQVGQNVAINVTLSVQTQTQTVTITEATPVVDETKSGVSDLVGDSQIMNLPINGRRVDSFVLLTPGVTSDGTFGLVSFRGIPGGNAYLTDGNDTTQGYYNENAGRTRISTNLSQDAVQEFQVQTSGYSAEFGRAVGGVINTVTRSGSNRMHGTGYWFFRNHSLNARDRYASTNPKESRHQAGGSIGGPIKADKIFYFVNYDMTRRDFPLVSSIQNPQLFTPAGNFVGTCNASAQQCSNAISYFQRFFGVVPRTANQDAGFAKIDWRPNESNALSLSFNIMNWTSVNGIQTQAALTTGAGVGNNGDSTVKHRFARVAHTGIISPNLVNESRFGWFKDRLFDKVNADLAPPNGLLGQLSVQGQGNLGVATFLPRVQPTEDRFQFADNLTWLTGRHNFKFGVDIAHTRDKLDLLSTGRGSYTYANFTDFALDLTNTDGLKHWQRYQQAFGEPFIEIYVRDFNFFAQDQWRVNSRITLNYGLRYEYAQFAQPAIVNPDYAQTARINQPKSNFAPRFGFAATLDKSGKSVLRGGYGIFYARMPGALVGNLHQNNGVYQKFITLNNTTTDYATGPVFPNYLPSIERNPPSGTVSMGFADSNLRAPYTQQWDLGYEREIARDTGITVSYLGSRGLRFFMTRDLNAGAFGPEVTYNILDSTGAVTGTYTTPTYLRANRPDARYNQVTQLENAGNTWYNALVVQFRKRASKWVQGSASYTLSHASDYSQGGGNSNLFVSSDFVRTVFNGQFRQEKGTSELDQRHRLVVNGLVTPPAIRSDNWAVKHIVNDWSLSVIGTFASAQYATPSLRVQSLPFTGAHQTSTLNGFGGSNRAPFLSRTSLPVDEVTRIDARLSKTFNMTERLRTTLGFEAFNVFNHVSNTSVRTEAYAAQGVNIRPTAGVGTGSASQGFPDGTNARRAQVSLRVIF